MLAIQDAVHHTSWQAEVDELYEFMPPVDDDDPLAFDDVAQIVLSDTGDAPGVQDAIMLLNGVFADSGAASSTDARTAQLVHDNTATAHTEVVGWLTKDRRMHLEGSKCFFKDGDVKELVGVTASMGMRNGKAPEYFQAQCCVKHEAAGAIDPPSSSIGSTPAKRKKEPACRMFLKFAYDSAGCECALNNWLIHGYSRKMTSSEHIELGKKTMVLLEDYWQGLIPD